MGPSILWVVWQQGNFLLAFFLQQVRIVHRRGRSTSRRAAAPPPADMRKRVDVKKFEFCGGCGVTVVDSVLRVRDSVSSGVGVGSDGSLVASVTVRETVCEGTGDLSVTSVVVGAAEGGCVTVRETVCEGTGDLSVTSVVVGAAEGGCVTVYCTTVISEEEGEGESVAAGDVSECGTRVCTDSVVG